MRIASLIPSATEILYALGLGDSLVGVSHECDFPPPALAKPRLTRSNIDSGAGSAQIDEQVRRLMASGGALCSIDTDLLASLRPDLIVTQSQCDVCAVHLSDVMAAVAARRELQATRVIGLNPRSLSEVLADITVLGEATHSQDSAAKLHGQLAGRIAAVTKRVGETDPRGGLRVALIEWIEPLMLSGNWLPEMIRLAGGRQDLTAPDRPSPYVTWEALATFDPEVILVLPCGFGLPRTLAESTALPAQTAWPALSAVRSGRVFAVDGNAYFNRPGPRLVDSLEILAHLLWPQRVPPPAHCDPAVTWQRLG